MPRDRVHPHDIPKESDPVEVGYSKALSLVRRFPSPESNRLLAAWARRLREETVRPRGRTRS